MKPFLLTALGAATLCSGAFAQGTDDCASAQAIAGNAVFNYDNGAATTDGAPDPLCYKFGTSDIENDVWFAWTAPADDDYEVTTCNLTTLDTRIAIYDGTDCVNSPMIACNDDQLGGLCGLQSQAIAMGLTSGNTYLIRIGSFPGAVPGAGQFEVKPFVVPTGPANDDCANAETISGCGSFNYDTTLATTDGVGDVACYKFGTSQIDNDVWFSWTAPSNDTFTADTCLGAGHDTKIAVYDAGACPASPALDCNDDTCGLSSQVTWSGTAGSTYLIRIGSFPGAVGAPGFFDINGCSTAVECEGETAGNYCTQTNAFTSGLSTISSSDGLQPSLSGGVGGAGTLTLSANNLPVQPGLFIGSPTQMAPFAGLPLNFGELCIGTTGLVRLGAGADVPVGGVSTQTYDYSAAVFTGGGPLIPLGAVAGESWSFQRWNRDPGNPTMGCTGGPCVSGFSDAITVCFQM